MAAHPYREFARYRYSGLLGTPSECRLRLYRKLGGGTVAIASELPDNPGASITNVAVGLAMQVWQQNGKPADFAWIEHYPADQAHAEDTYDLVGYDEQTAWRPRWRHLDTPELAALLGGLPE